MTAAFAEVARRLLPGLVLGAPFGWMLWVVLFVPQQLGPDAGKVLVTFTGIWALRLLLLVLALPLLRQLTGWVAWIHHRRSVGVAVALYGLVHLSLFVWFYLGGSLVELATEVLERPYVLAGTAALLLLLPLAITSTRGWMRRLGRRWKQLHRGVYAAALLASLHFIWLSRGDYTEPAAYALAAAALLGWRLRRAFGGLRRPPVIAKAGP